MTNGFRLSLIVAGLMAAFAHAGATVPDRVSTATYNAQGLVQTLDGPRTDVSDVTHFAYDAQGRIASVTDALGHIKTFDTYDPYGNPGRSVGANNVTTLMSYTPEGWLQTVTRDSTGTPSTMTFTYDAVGDVIQTQDADSVVMHYTYDDARRLTDITDGAGNHIHYTLDAADNRTKEETFDASNTLRRSLSRTYNSLSQILTVVDALNRTVLSFNYPDGHDAMGHPVHSSDANSIQRKVGYDALNRLVSTIDNYNGTDTATQNTQSVSAYDVSDNLEGVNDPDGLSTTYDHNGLGDLTALHSPDTGTTSYLYDAAGNATQKTDAKGIVVNYTYDALNRLATVSYADTALNAAYHYDEADAVTGCTGSFPVGHLTRVVESAVTTTYCYDARGNLVQKRQAQGSQVDVTGYGYTLADRVSQITYPSQTVTQYGRNALGQITSVTVAPSGGATQTAVSGVTYLPFGPISGYVLGNGQTVARSYDANYQLTDLTSPALSLHFARDAMGNITALGNSPGANPALETYSYDPLYRLAGVNDATGSAIEAYTYSKTGDRLSKTQAGGLATGTYGYQSGTHWLTSIGSAVRTYDLNGNTTGSASAGESLGYGYDGRGRLTLVQRNQQTVATYVYNVMGERIAKAVTSPQLTERFAYNGASQLIGEYGTTNRDYIWLDSLPIAVVDGGAGGNITIGYIHADGLGAPRAISDIAGNTIWQWSFRNNPFGDQVPSGGYSYNLRFPGQYYDAESLLTYNQSRYYDSSIGRYIESDSLGLGGGLDTYSYVSNNPLAFIDFYGTQLAPPGEGYGVPQSQEYWDMQAHNPERILGFVLFGTNIDHVNPPHDDSIQSVASPVEWAVGGGLVRGGGAALRAFSICRGAAASGLGDLTVDEVEAIQSVVDRAQRPLDVVGSAARGARRGVGTKLPVGKGPGTRSDIDYLAPPYGIQYFDGFQELLPSIDPAGGISPGVANPYIGPSIRFEPGAVPFYVPGS